MARGPRYNLPFRRRRDGLTHYGKRRRLVTSGIPRLVVRPSNKHITAQLIEAWSEGDKVLASAHSVELKEFGWKAPCGNLSAAYLTGLLAGHRAKAAGAKQAILDIGLHSTRPGSRIFAAAKGALDAGLTLPHGESIFPSRNRIRGEHVATYSDILSKDAEAFKKRFSQYQKQKLKPQDLPTHFDEVEAKVIASFPEASK